MPNFTGPFKCDPLTVEQKKQMLQKQYPNHRVFVERADKLDFNILNEFVAACKADSVEGIVMIEDLDTLSPREVNELSGWLSAGAQL